MNMNMQDMSDECAQKFLDKVKEKMGDTSKVPTDEIARYCRMLMIYCESGGKVTESFLTSMQKCVEKITAVDGMEEIFNECNKCPENL